MRRTKLTTDIKVPAELWSTNILPEGILERWIFADDASVEAGDPVAAVAALDEDVAFAPWITVFPKSCYGWLPRGGRRSETQEFRRRQRRA